MCTKYIIIIIIILHSNAIVKMNESNKKPKHNTGIWFLQGL